MLKFYSGVLLFFLSVCSFGQTNIILKGKILDKKTQNPLEATTVYLTSVKDSSVIDYTISDKNGFFKIETKKIGKPFFLKISNIGYQIFKQEISEVKTNKDFGLIYLTESTNVLGEVIVKTEAPPIRIKKDTLEFNVSSFKVRPDANVETLLKQLPGVEIDSDGKITVNGKEVNQVLVNGKPFFDKDGKIALQNLPSDIIKKVQVTDTKTKKEEKTGQASSSNNASINLTIDEDKNKGFFGKFMGGFGSDNRFESSALVNYFKNKRKISVLASSNNINSTGFSMDEVFDNMGGGGNRSVWFNNDGSFGINGRTFGSGKGITRSEMLGVNYSDEWSKKIEISTSYFYSEGYTYNENRTNSINFLPTGNFSTNSNSTTNENHYVHNASAVFEYKIDSTTSIVIEPNFTKSNSKNHIKSNQASFDETNTKLNESNSDNFYESNSNIFSNTLSFTKSFKKRGRYLSLVFENNNSENKQNDYINSNTIFYQQLEPDDTRNQQNYSKTKTDSYRTELEYTIPMTDSLRIKLGVENKLNTIKDNKNSFDFDLTNQSYTVVNDLLTSAFHSVEKTNQPNVGIIFDMKKINFNLNLGTSLIQSNYDSDYLNAKNSLNRSFILPYINGYGNYRFSKSKNIWLNYNYQYDLPTAKQVLPVADLSDPLNTYLGNPNIGLNKYHGIYLSYRNFDYSTRSGYGLYSGGNFYENEIVSSVNYDQNTKSTTTYDNVSGTYNSWLGVYLNKTIKKELQKFRYELRVTNNFGLSKGFTNSQLYTAKSYSFSPRINLTYDYGELLTINPSYNYSYNKTNYTNYVVGAASNFMHKFNLETTSYWPKNWVFGNDFGYTYNSNIADGYKKDFYLWNTSLSYGFYNKKIMAKVKIYDLLNQNQNATRTITPTTIRDEENIVLKRYVMFSLTYKLEKFAGKEKKSGGMMWF